mmetsp:Transcript_32376/g.102977  ORF Transcript_32376/g.102977 Transcript_32376/m.102977 type:complete len:337 (+) Transcript_32376:28-1038(+)
MAALAPSAPAAAAVRACTARSARSGAPGGSPSPPAGLPAHGTQALASSLASRLAREARGLRAAGIRVGRSCRTPWTAPRAAGAQGGVAIADLQAVDAKTVVLTREAGNNEKLIEPLRKLGINSIEVPMIEHGVGKDLPLLPPALKEGFTYVVVTSPEAARVFLGGWEEAGKPDVRIATVGAATGKVIEDAGLEVTFVPSKATAKVLAVEIPRATGAEKVLYPASALAGTDLQEGLAARGFEVVRLDTYTTQAVTAIDPATIEAVRGAGIVAFGSPSAAKAWISVVGEGAMEPAAACIGETSANACEELGFARIFFPEKPGIAGWVEAIQEALQDEL